MTAKVRTERIIAMVGSNSRCPCGTRLVNISLMEEEQGELFSLEPTGKFRSELMIAIRQGAVRLRIELFSCLRFRPM